MLHPDFTAEIARQHQQRLVSSATLRRASKRVATEPATPRRARRLALAWFVIPSRQHAG